MATLYREWTPIKEDVQGPVQTHFNVQRGRILGEGDDGYVSLLPREGEKAVKDKHEHDEEDEEDEEEYDYDKPLPQDWFVVKQFHNSSPQHFQQAVREVIGSGIAATTGAMIPVTGSGYASGEKEEMFIVLRSAGQLSEAESDVSQGHTFIGKALGEFLLSVDILHAAGFSHSDLDSCNALAFDKRVVPNDFARLRSMLLSERSLQEIKKRGLSICSRETEDRCDSRHYKIGDGKGDPITGKKESISDDVHYAVEFAIDFCNSVLTDLISNLKRLKAKQKAIRKGKGSKFVLSFIRSALNAAWDSRGLPRNEELSEKEKRFDEFVSVEDISWTRPAMQMWFIVCMKEMRFSPLKFIATRQWRQFLSDIRYVCTSFQVNKAGHGFKVAVGNLLRIAIASMRVVARSRGVDGSEPTHHFSPIGCTENVLLAMRTAFFSNAEVHAEVLSEMRRKVNDADRQWTLASLSQPSPAAKATILSGTTFHRRLQELGDIVLLANPSLRETRTFESFLTRFDEEEEVFEFMRAYGFMAPLVRVCSRLLFNMVKDHIAETEPDTQTRLGMNTLVIMFSCLICSPGYEVNVFTPHVVQALHGAGKSDGSYPKEQESEAVKALLQFVSVFAPECVLSFLFAEKMVLSFANLLDGEAWSSLNATEVISASKRGVGVHAVRHMISEAIKNECSFASVSSSSREEVLADVALLRSDIECVPPLTRAPGRRSMKYGERRHVQEDRVLDFGEARGNEFVLDVDSKRLEFIDSAGRAKKGDPEALHATAFYYEKGNQVKKDREKAFELWLRAAGLGHTDSMRQVALAFEKGTVIKQNLKRAFKWHMKAAENSDASALDAAMMLLEGKGVRKDAGHAAHILRVLSQNEVNKSARFELGKLLLEGDVGVPKAVDEGVELLKQAAEYVEDAALLLGTMYEEGDKVERDFAMAASIYDKLLFYKPEVKFRLGLMYEEGRGVPQDIKKAVEVFERTAARGHVPSLERLRMLMHTGHELPERAKELVEEFVRSLPSHHEGKRKADGDDERSDPRKRLRRGEDE